MRILILGGTRFVGVHLTRIALERGHRVSVFTRGKSEIAPGGVEALVGDRDGKLDALRGRTWDAVIDTSGYVPRIVRQSAELLRGATGSYVFTSSISVYPHARTPGLDETHDVATLKDEAVEEITGETYGGLKALCERAVQDVFGERALISRPGLIVGDYDPTDRFTYWPWRIAQGGEVLLPGSPGLPVQFIDAEDWARWTLDLVQRGVHGVFNATGHPITMGQVVTAAADVSGAHIAPVWADEAWLLEQGVQPWSELPLWVPTSDPDNGCMMQMSIRKAVDQGLTFKPLAQTMRDTLAWARTRPADYKMKAGISREREAEIIARWREQGRARM